MTATQKLRLYGAQAPPLLWAQVARASRDFALAAGLDLRELVVCVPFVQAIEPARVAFAALAAQSGWLPRIETLRTLAESIGPPPPAVPGMLSGDPLLDRLQLADSLRRRPALADWQAQDPRAFAQAVAAAVDAALAWQAVAAARAPALRSAALEALRSQLPTPSSLEGSLLHEALDWVMRRPEYLTDLLFSHPAAGWVVVQAGGADPLAAALLAHARGPALWIDTDPDPAAPWAQGAVDAAAPTCLLAAGFEGEAAASTQAVCDAIEAGALPVALIALDRMLVRRVRALLERRGVRVADETGWTLSTTRAGAHLQALLRAAAPRPGRDDQLMWLKVRQGLRAGANDADGMAAVARRVESAWRRDRPVDAAGQALLAAASADLAALTQLQRAGATRHPLPRWCQALDDVLQRSGLDARLQADPAGAQLLQALRTATADPGWAPVLQAQTVDFSGFRAWIDSLLEGSSFVPAPPPDASVVLTPLARAVLRPFGAAVLAAADEHHLGALVALQGLISPALAGQTGLPTPTELLARERAAFVQLLRLPRLTLVRRRAEGDEPWGESRFVTALSLERERAGLPPLAWQTAAAPCRAVTAQPIQRPAPGAGGALPAELSATAIQRLRDCPYRFFARSVLRLDEAEELERETDKRDQGNWLHDALERFHRQRAAAGGRTPDDAQALRDAAAAVLEAAGIEPHRMLPWRAAFEALLPDYLAWLAAHEEQGWAWNEGEQRAERHDDALGGVVLAGRIDRIDLRAPMADDPAAPTVVVIDYKTGSVKKYRSAIRENRYEDTQLAFYGALLRADDLGDGSISAAYLGLGGAEGPDEVAHPELADSARALLAGLAHDLGRLRAGAGLAALGEGRTCETCEARGLCRRDHWSSAP